MQYTILIYDAASNSDPNTPHVMAAHFAYGALLVEAGVMRGGQGLQPPQTAKSLRLKQGQRVVHDGPFADTKEQLGGFYIIEAESMEAALHWAKQCPVSSDGGIEVRETLPGPN
ncbi:MAG: YciI family protein [Pseudomonadota bacterium]